LSGYERIREGFGVEPGMRVMTTVPWIFVPAAIVPALLLSHAEIARRYASTFAQARAA
jgi:hypothetical protein